MGQFLSANYVKDNTGKHEDRADKWLESNKKLFDYLGRTVLCNISPRIFALFHDMGRMLTLPECYNQGEAAGYLYPQCPPTSRQDCQVRVTTCKDHMIYNHVICTMQGHVTSEQHEPTGGLARRAHIASRASQQVRELAELTL